MRNLSSVWTIISVLAIAGAGGAFAQTDVTLVNPSFETDIPTGDETYPYIIAAAPTGWGVEFAVGPDVVQEGVFLFVVDDATVDDRPADHRHVVQ